jgi:hypothetical protein
MPNHRFHRFVSFALGVSARGRDAPSPPPPDEAAPATPPAWTVTPGGIGPIRIGWSIGELNAATGEQLRPTYQISDECDYLRPARLPAGVNLMVVKDTVIRVDVDTAGVLTGEGAGIGDTEARIIAMYPGQVEVQPHKYTGPEGHYLVVTVPSDTLLRIIFETDGRIVTRYRAGRRPAVEYVEGCA